MRMNDDFCAGFPKICEKSACFSDKFQKKVTWFCNILKIKEIKMQKSGKKFGVIK